MTTPITTSQTTQQLALNNELFVKQLENALKDAHLPPNTLREMIINVNKDIASFLLLKLKKLFKNKLLRFCITKL